jgi:hypothetical protein
MNADPAEHPLIIEHVEVAPERVDATVRVVSQRYMRTSGFPETGRRALALLPGIERHRCECGASHGITAELADTETPHLLEHVALELMVLSGSPRTLRGDTRWDFKQDGPGTFHVLLDYDDDLAALGALKEGACIVEALLQDAPAPDIEAAVARLREARST